MMGSSESSHGGQGGVRGVSVVIPAYNAEAHVGRAIESVLAQSRPADEIIVVDDGSSDATATAAQACGEQVRVIVQENAGAGAARNRGVREARSEWVAFLDADDEWLPEKLARQMEQLADHEGLDWTCSNFFEARQGEPLQVARQAERARVLLSEGAYFATYFEAYAAGFYAWTSTIVVRRRLLVEAGLFAENMGRAQDTDLWFRLAYRSPRIGYWPEPLAIYHLSTPASISKVLGGRDPEVLGDLIERHLPLAQESGFGQAFGVCASRMLQVLMTALARQTRRDELGELLRKFADLLPWRFRTEMRLRASWPRTASVVLALTAAAKKVHRQLGGRQRKGRGTAAVETVSAEGKVSSQEQHE